MALVEPHVCGGGHVPELASCTSLMLAPAAVSTVTPNGSAPTAVTSPSHPPLALACKAPSWKRGQVLQK